MTGLPDAAVSRSAWSDDELLALMRKHAPPGVLPEAMLPMLRELVDAGADPRSLIAVLHTPRPGEAPQARAAIAPQPKLDADPSLGNPPTRTPRAGTDLAGPNPRGGARRSRGWRKTVWHTAIIVFWLTVWEAADRAVDNRLLLAGPIRTLQALGEQVQRPEFWAISGASLGRIVIGFAAALVAGILLSLVAHRLAWFRDLIAPVISVMKTVPVVSFIIMLLIWLGGQALTSWLAFFIVMPLVYTSMLAGLGAVGHRELERATVYRVSPWKRFWYLSRPAFMPFLTSACKVGVGMSWRAGIMAELFAATAQSIGKEMFTAKTFLDTPTLFAWTLVVMVLSIVFERVVMLLMRFFSRPFGGLLGSAS